jgi:hypothetical protein
MANIVTGHGALCDAYEDNHGAFNAEGDTPAFLPQHSQRTAQHRIAGWGGWGGRFVNIRAMYGWTQPDSSYTHPTGQWTSRTVGPGAGAANGCVMASKFGPLTSNPWRWMDDVQNDFAARADWCVQS